MSVHAAALVVVALAVPALAQAGNVQRLGVVHVEHGATVAAAKHPGQLIYHGGGFMQSSTVVSVYWRPSGWSGGTISDGFRSIVDGYLGNVHADSAQTSNVYSDAVQYGTNYNVAYGGSYIDTDPVPTNRDTGPPNDCADVPLPQKCLSDNQVINEVYNFAQSHGITGDSGFGPFNPTKMIVFFLPPGLVDCFTDFDGVTHYCSGRSGGYCAYHEAFGDSGLSLTWNYANMPYVWNLAGCQEGQAPNGSMAADSAVSVTSHEFVEAMTDPYGDAWFDANGYEIADKCDQQFGTVLGSILGAGQFNQVVGTGHYWTQLEYSNQLGGCYQLGPPTISTQQDGGAGSTVQITGTNLFGPVVVDFNGIASSSVSVNDAGTAIQAVVPPGNVTGRVVVHGVGGDVSGSQVFDFPTLTSLSSNLAYAGSTITLHGLGLSGLQSVRFNGIAASFGNVDGNGTSATAIVPHSATDGEVTFTTPAGTSRGHFSFSVLPKVDTLTPTTSSVGNSITLSGSGLAGATAVRFTGGAVGTVTANDPNNIVVTIPSGAKTGPVTVTTPNGSATSAAGLKLAIQPTRTGHSNPWPHSH